MEYDIKISKKDDIDGTHHGIAYYVFDTGNIHIVDARCAPIIENILWHETIHKLLYEGEFSDFPYATSFCWDYIAYELEDFLFR